MTRAQDLSPAKNYAENLTKHLGWEGFIEVDKFRDILI
jgi:hypothetical protein